TKCDGSDAQVQRANAQSKWLQAIKSCSGGCVKRRNRPERETANDAGQHGIAVNNVRSRFRAVDEGVTTQRLLVVTYDWEADVAGRPRGDFSGKHCPLRPGHALPDAEVVSVHQVFHGDLPSGNVPCRNCRPYSTTSSNAGSSWKIPLK